MGGGCNRDELIHALHALNIHVSIESFWLMERVCEKGFGPERTVRLVLKTVSELGRHVTVAGIEEAARNEGLMLCPIDTALFLRSEYSALRVGEMLRIVSPPLDLAGRPHVFTVVRSRAGILLDAVKHTGDALVDPEERLVFCKYGGIERAD